MVDGFITSVLGSLAVKYLPAFMRRRSKTREASGNTPPVAANFGDARVELLESASRSTTDATMAAFLLRAAVNAADGKIRFTGEIVQSSEGERPAGPVTLKIGGEVWRPGTAAEAIRIVSAVELLRRQRCIAHDQSGRDTVVYRITAAGVATDDRTTFVHREVPHDAIPRAPLRGVISSVDERQHD